MVPGYGNAVRPQSVADLLHQFPGQTIDDPTLSWMDLHKILKGCIFILGGLYAEIKIGAVISGCNHHRILKHENIYDILPHLFGRCGGKRADHRAFWEFFYEIHYFQIAGAEILSPLGHAVGLVNGHHGDLCVQGKIQEPFRLQALRSHIDNGIAPFPCKAEGFIILARGQ